MNNFLNLYRHVKKINPNKTNFIFKYKIIKKYFHTTIQNKKFEQLYRWQIDTDNKILELQNKYPTQWRFMGLYNIQWEKEKNIFNTISKDADEYLIHLKTKCNIIQDFYWDDIEKYTGIQTYMYVSNMIPHCHPIDIVYSLYKNNSKYERTIGGFYQNYFHFDLTLIYGQDNDIYNLIEQQQSNVLRQKIFSLKKQKENELLEYILYISNIKVNEFINQCNGINIILESK